MAKYHVGDVIEFNAGYTKNGLAVDPGTVTIDWRNPAGTWSLNQATTDGGRTGARKYAPTGATKGKYLALFMATGDVDQKQIWCEEYVDDTWATVFAAGLGVLTSALTAVESLGKFFVDRLDAAISTRSTLTGAQAADAIADELLAGHLVAGSAAVAWAAAGSAADPLTNAVPGTYPAGSAGAALGKISTGTATVLTAQSLTGTIEVRRGISYSGTEALSWTDTEGVWPDLVAGVGETLAITVTAPGGTEYAGVITQATTPNRKVSLALTAAQTLAMTRLLVSTPSKLARYSVVAEWTTSGVITHAHFLANGPWTVANPEDE